MAEVKVKITGENQDALNALNEVEDKGKGIGGKLAGGLKTAGVVAGAALASAAAAIGVVGKQAYEAYAQYEQLIGGVDKLYGDASGKLQQYAAEAYKTSGMSANQYMESATSFSAALINSLGGDVNKAADMTDVAMRAISDNVNVFGTRIEDVERAVQGFSRGQYGMLDNLKLGYGGTKSEMERLIADANEYAKSIGEAGDLTIDSFADQIQAIDLIQQKQGIAGATAKEAATTIEGSTRMAGAAWENLLAHLGDPDADLDGLITQFTDALGTMIEVATPTILQIGQSIADALPAILPQILNLAMGLIQTLAGALLQMAPDIIAALVSVFTLLVQALPEFLPVIVDAVAQLIAGVGQALVDNAPTILDALASLLTSAVQAIPTYLPQVLAGALKLFGAIATAIVQNGPQILAALGRALMQTVQEIGRRLPEFLNQARQIPARIGQGISAAASGIWNALRNALSNAISNAAGWVSGAVGGIGRSIIDGIVGGVTGAAGRLASAAGDAVNGALSKAKSVLGIASPSKVFRDQVGKMVVEGAAQGILNNAFMFDDAVAKTFSVDLGGFKFATAPSVSYGGNSYNVVLDYQAGEDAFQLALDTSRALQRFDMARG